MSIAKLRKLLPLRVKLIGGMGVMVALALFSGGMSLWIANMAVENSRFVNGPIAERAAADQAYASMLKSEVVEQAFVNSREIELVSRFDEYIEEVEEGIGWILESTESEDWAQSLELAQSKIIEYKKSFHQVADLMEFRGLSEKEGLEG